MNRKNFLKRIFSGLIAFAVGSKIDGREVLDDIEPVIIKKEELSNGVYLPTLYPVKELPDVKDCEEGDLCVVGIKEHFYIFDGEKWGLIE